MHTDEQLVAKTAGLETCACMAVVCKVEAAIDPDTLFQDGHVFLRVDRPVPWRWDVLGAVSISSG